VGVGRHVVTNRPGKASCSASIQSAVGIHMAEDCCTGGTLVVIPATAVPMIIAASRCPGCVGPDLTPPPTLGVRRRVVHRRRDTACAVHKPSFRPFSLALSPGQRNVLVIHDDDPERFDHLTNPSPQTRHWEIHSSYQLPDSPWVSSLAEQSRTRSS
jgi:hypothetical protein